VQMLDRLILWALDLNVDPADENGLLRLTLYSGGTASLERVLVLLRSLDLEIVDQHRSVFWCPDGLDCTSTTSR